MTPIYAVLSLLERVEPLGGDYDWRISITTGA